MANLSTHDLQTAWKLKIISDDTARRFLQGMNYSRADSGMMIDLWQGQEYPGYAKLPSTPPRDTTFTCIYCGSTYPTRRTNCDNCGGNQFTTSTAP